MALNRESKKESPTLDDFQVKEKKHYFKSEAQPESEEYVPYECIACGRREDEIPDEEDAGTVYRSNSREPTASETFVCGRCLSLLH